MNIVFFGDIHSTQGNALVNIAKNDDYNSNGFLMQCIIVLKEHLEKLDQCRFIDHLVLHCAMITLTIIFVHGSIFMTVQLFMSIMIGRQHSFSLKKEMEFYYCNPKEMKGQRSLKLLQKQHNNGR